MIIAGLDLSLTSTGVAVLHADQELGNTITLHRLQPRKRTGHERLDWILSAVGKLVDEADVVAVEGPSYGSTGGSQHERGGLWWLVTHVLLWSCQTPYVTITPSQLKKYATGAGNAGKDTVLAATVRRYQDVSIDGNDTADALVLVAMTAGHYGFPLRQMPKLNESALTTVAWPDLGVQSALPGAARP